MRKIVEICKKTGKPYKTVPSLSEMIDKEISLDVIRDVSYADLLGRDEVKLDMNRIEQMLKEMGINYWCRRLNWIRISQAMYRVPTLRNDLS